MKIVLQTLILFLINFSITNAIELKKYYQFPENYFKGKYSETTKNFLLVATNRLKDSRFKNTVILIKEHDSSGAIGIVINKKIGIGNINSLTKNTKKENDKNKKSLMLQVPIFWGGPLDQNKIFVIHSKDYKINDTKVLNDISISNNHKILFDIAENKGPKDYLIILGLAAWNIGQLEGEIDRGLWNLSEIDKKIIFEETVEKKHEIASKKSFLRL